MIRYDRTPRGGWRAEVDGVAVEARTLESARRAIVSEVAKRRSTYAGNVVLADDVALPRPAASALANARRARAAAVAADAAAATATSVAARQLTEVGLSLRDVAYLLGLSHGRIQQLLGADTHSSKEATA